MMVVRIMCIFIIILPMQFCSRTNLDLNPHSSHLKIDHVQVRQLEINLDGVQHISKYVMCAMHAPTEDIRFYLWAILQKICS